MDAYAGTRRIFDSNARCLGCMEPKAQPGACPHCGWNESRAGSVLHLQPGTVLHDVYVVGRVLGQGGFGITYIGWDTALSRKIAIKEYFPQSLASRQNGNTTVLPNSERSAQDFEYGMRSFLEEGKILALFSEHPCIVPVMSLFEANGTAYLVMGYVEGITLAQYLASKGGRIPFAQALEIMDRVMDGLREVHSQNLLHRDISPDNIYLTKGSTVKILDFGAARFSVGERSQSLSVVLKPGYAPEEQYRRNGKQGPWTDVYATAATLYRCITGTVPPEALDRMAEDTLQMPSQLGASVPPNVEIALGQALAIRAEQRFASMDAFQTALHGGAMQVTAPPNPGPIAPPPPGPTQPGPQWVGAPPEPPKKSHTARNVILGIVGGAILMLVALIGLGVYLNGSKPTPKPQEPRADNPVSPQPQPTAPVQTTTTATNTPPPTTPAEQSTPKSEPSHLRPLQRNNADGPSTGNQKLRVVASAAYIAQQMIQGETKSAPAAWQCDGKKFKIRQANTDVYMSSAEAGMDALLHYKKADGKSFFGGVWYSGNTPTSVTSGYMEMTPSGQGEIRGFMLRPTRASENCNVASSGPLKSVPAGCTKIPMVWKSRAAR